MYTENEIHLIMGWTPGHNLGADRLIRKCACCGGIFPMDEIEKCERYPTWVNFSEEI